MAVVRNLCGIPNKKAQLDERAPTRSKSKRLTCEQGPHSYTHMGKSARTNAAEQNEILHSLLGRVTCWNRTAPRVAPM